MARKRQRFSRLFDQLKAAGLTGGTPDSDVDKFRQYLTSASGTKLKWTPEAKSRIRENGGKSIILLSAIPFNKEADATTPVRYPAGITGYSLNKYKAELGVTSGLTVFGLDDGDKAVDIIGYYPALIKTNVIPDKTTYTEPPSGITGKNYRKYTDAYNCATPFGRKTTDVKKSGKTEAVTDVSEADEYNTAQAIVGILEAKSSGNKIVRCSVESEVWKENRPGTKGKWA